MIAGIIALHPAVPGIELRVLAPIIIASFIDVVKMLTACSNNMVV